MAEPTITLTKSQLQEMIDAAIEEHAQALQPQGLDAGMGTQIGEAVAAGMAKANPPRVKYGQYMKRVHSTFHPDPAFPNGPPLTREYYINGHHEGEQQLKDDEIRLLNQITHSGRYINRLVEVIVANEGLDEVVQIRYDNTKNSELPNHSRSLTETLTMVCAAQADEREEMEVVEMTKKEARVRFGNAKASREAREKAGVV